MGQKRKIHNRIGRSVLILPVSTLLMISLWWFPQRLFNADYAFSLLLALLTAYVIVETNNTFQLIRVRSYMISSVWLFGMATMGMFHVFQSSLFAAFCLAVGYYLLFRTYQQSQSVVDSFHAFFMLALGSLAYSPLLFVAPFFLWYLLVFLRALSFRSFCAALVGFILPFWFWLGWMLWQNDFTSILAWKEGCLVVAKGCAFWEWHGTESISFIGDRYGGMSLSDLISHVWCLLLLGILTLWTSVYYLFNSYDDKIRTRMMLYIYVFQAIIIFTFALLSAVTFYFSGGEAGEDAFTCLPMLLLSCAPLMAHYFTLCNTWTSFLMFFLILLLFLGLATCSLWPESVDFMINFVKTSPFIG